MRLALGFLGVTQLAIGVWLIVSPDSFVDTVADFGPADAHFLRDLGTFQAGLGIALLAAVGRPAWRVPVLFAALAQSALHTINHLFDIGDTDPGWQGPVNFVGVLLLTGAFAYLMQEAGREGTRRGVRDGRAPRRERLPV